MRRLITIVGLFASLAGPWAAQAHAQSPTPAAPPAASDDSSASPIDGVAARIEDDVILESEVRELAAFQVLSDGQPKPRNELIRELADQWIVRGEANTAKFAFPSADEIENAYREFVKQFLTEEFQKRLTAADLTRPPSTDLRAAALPRTLSRVSLPRRRPNRRPGGREVLQRRIRASAQGAE